MAPEVWFCLNARKKGLGYLDIGGGGLALTTASVVTVTDANGLRWDVENVGVHNGRLRIRVWGKKPKSMKTEDAVPPVGTLSVTVTNPPAGTITLQVAYVDEDPPPPPP